MLFPLHKGFSSTGIFQKSGNHHDRVLRRVWSIDHSGQSERVKEVHQLIQDKKPYKCHEMLAKRRAVEGKKQDQERMATFKAHLGDMKTKIEQEAEERRHEMIRGIKAYKARNQASDTAIRDKMKELADDHKAFLKDMDTRVAEMPPIMGDNPPRETAERTEARRQARLDVTEGVKKYKQDIANLQKTLDDRGDMEWKYKPRPSQESVIRQKKAAGISQLSQQKEEYEAFLEQMDAREHQRMLGEQRQRRKEAREAGNRLADTNATFLQGLNDTHTTKKNELADIMARVNSRPNGRPDHPEFGGYCAAGYQPVLQSKKRQCDLAAEKQDKDGNDEECSAKMMTLSIPLAVRNKICREHPPRSFTASIGLQPMEWTDMSWAQRWKFVSQFLPERALSKFKTNAGVDTQELSMSGMTATEQRTLSPRTLGLASAS